MLGRSSPRDCLSKRVLLLTVGVVMEILKTLLLLFFLVLAGLVLLFSVAQSGLCRVSLSQHSHCREVAVSRPPDPLTVPRTHKRHQSPAAGSKPREEPWVHTPVRGNL